MKPNKNFSFLANQEILTFVNQMENNFYQKDFSSIPLLAKRIVQLVFEREYERKDEAIANNIQWYKECYDQPIVVDALYQINKWSVSDSNKQELSLANALLIIKSISIFLQDTYLEKPKYEFTERPYIDFDEQQTYKRESRSVNASELAISKSNLMDLFLDKRVIFEIPFYQRKYTWDKSQLLVLHEDIKSRIEDRHHHYFGVIAIKKEDMYNKKQIKIKVIDGQQRITTSLLLLKAAYNNMADREIKKIDTLAKLFESDLKWSDRYLNTSIDSNAFNEFKEILNKQYTPSFGWRYGKNYEYFYDIFNQLDRQEIYDYISTFTTKFEIAIVEYDVTPDREMDIFENMNSKGTELQEWDLIRNHIFNLIKTNEVENKEKVQIMNQNFLYDFKANMQKDAEEKELSDFFREYIHLIIAKNDAKYKNFDRFVVYKNFKEQFKELINSKKDYELLLDDFRKFAIIYKSLKNKDCTILDENLSKVSLRWNNIALKKVNCFIIFQLIDRFGEWNGEKWVFEEYDNIFRFIKLLDSYLIRLWVARGFGMAFRNFGIEVVKLLNRDWNNNNWEKYFKRIVKNSETLNVSDIEFENAIINGGIKSTIAQKLLLQIEEYLVQEYDFNSSSNEKRAFIEKVMPNDYSKWKDFLKSQSHTYIDEYKRHIDLLGNFYLLSQKLKSSSEIEIFENKKEKLLEQNTPMMQGVSELGLKSLSDIREWTFEEIKARNKAITKILCKKIYSID